MALEFPIELEFISVGFVEGGNPENPEKNTRSRDENQQQTQPTYDARGPFLKGPEKFSHPESHSKVSNLMITELFNSMIILI